MIRDPVSPAGTADTRKSAGLSFGLAAPFLLGGFLLISSTTNLIPGLWPFDSKRIIQFGLLFSIFLLPLADRSIRKELDLILRFVPRWLKLTLLAIACTGVLSALVNAQTPLHAVVSISDVILLTSLLMAVAVVAACRRSAGRWFDRVALVLLAMTGLAVGLQELIGVAASRATGFEFSYEQSLLHFAHPRFYNQVQSWIVPLLAALPLAFSRNRFAVLACLLVLGLNWYLVLMTGARGSFVSITAALLISAILLPATRRPLLLWQLSGLLLGLLIYLGVMMSFEPDTSESTVHAEGQQSTQSGGEAASADEGSRFYLQSLGRPMLHSTGRLWAWKGVLNDIQAHPVLGIGPMNYACVETRWLAHPHNFPLQLAGEWGLPVALAVSILALLLFWRLVRTMRHATDSSTSGVTLASLLFAGLLAAMMHACLSGVLVMPASQLTGVLICGWLLGLHDPGKRQKPASHAVGLAVAGLMFCSALLTLGVYELSTMQQREAMKNQDEVMAPRMWQDSRLCRFYLHPNTVTN
jgi:hypothetical protein